MYKKLTGNEQAVITIDELKALGLNYSDTALEKIKKSANEQVYKRLWDDIFTLILSEDQILKLGETMETGDEKKCVEFLQQAVPNYNELVLSQKNIVLSDIADKIDEDNEISDLINAIDNEK